MSHEEATDIGDFVGGNSWLQPVSFWTRSLALRHTEYADDALYALCAL
jgi:hypothetical protein